MIKIAFRARNEAAARTGFRKKPVRVADGFASFWQRKKNKLACVEQWDE